MSTHVFVASMRRTLALVATCSLVACASPYRPLRIGAEEAIPSSVSHAVGAFDGAGGTQLFEQFWWGDSTKAAFVIVHGLYDHSNRYSALAERLVGEGFAVYAFDLRGHAHSEGERVYVDSFDQYLEDLDRLMKRVRAREPKRPVILFGHSMGGAIATLYTIRNQPELAGLVLSGAALQVGPEVSGGVKFGTRVIGSITPHEGVFALDLDKFSRDKAVVAETKNDPLVYHEPAPASTAAELLGAISKIQDSMEQVKVPVLAMHGGADSITPPEGSKTLVARAPNKDKTLKIYDGLYHDLLHEPEKDKVISDVVAWSKSHMK